MINTKGAEQIPLRKKVSKFLGTSATQQVNRKRVWKNESKGWWRDAQISQSKDVPWRITCKRMVEHVCSLFFVLL